jgi:hypothetical protein
MEKLKSVSPDMQKKQKEWDATTEKWKKGDPAGEFVPSNHQKWLEWDRNVPAPVDQAK